MARSFPKVSTAVAYGATVQGGILSGEIGTDDVVLVDACPLTLSIETTSDVFTNFIPRNIIIPMNIH